MRLRSITVLLLVVASAPVAPAQANGAATYKVGPLWCGAVRRSINTVQTYCLAPASQSQTVENTIRTVSVNFVDPTRYSLIVDYQYFYDPNSKSYVDVGWQFRIAGTGIDYFFNGCDVIGGVLVPTACQQFTGNFPIVYTGAVGPCITQLGALPSGVCRCLQIDRPRGCAFDLNFPWSGVVATISGRRVVANIDLRETDQRACISWPVEPPGSHPQAGNTRSACPVTEIGPQGEVIGLGQWLGLWIL